MFLILLTNAGRLIDHLDRTPGFTLQHLRFLVIDEADRLVNQSYQNWIQRVVDATLVGPEIIYDAFKEVPDNLMAETILAPVTWRRNADKAGSDNISLKKILDTSVCRPVQLRKLLFSATLTKDPKKLSSLGLINPKHFDAHQLNQKNKKANNATDSNNNSSSYILPETLSEFMVQCTAEQKPLVLLAVLLEQGLIDKKADVDNGIVVVFTSSKDSTHRLARLLQLLWVAAGYGETGNIAEFSSSMNQKQRADLVKRCNQKNLEPQIRIIVCSDGMSRGMDINSVSAVVNYDVPAYAKTYVHRCGRTARAGRKGRATTIMKGGQVSKFLKMRQLIGYPERVTKSGIKKDLARPAIPVYQKCIKALGRVMSAEANGDLSPVECLKSEWLT